MKTKIFTLLVVSVTLGIYSMTSGLAMLVEGNWHRPVMSIPQRNKWWTEVLLNDVSSLTPRPLSPSYTTHTIGITTRVSVATGKTQGDKPSMSPAISAEGWQVAFRSFTSNPFVLGVRNGSEDLQEGPFGFR